MRWRKVRWWLTCTVGGAGDGRGLYLPLRRLSDVLRVCASGAEGDDDEEVKSGNEDQQELEEEERFEAEEEEEAVEAGEALPDDTAAPPSPSTEDEEDEEDEEEERGGPVPDDIHEIEDMNEALHEEEAAAAAVAAVNATSAVRVLCRVQCTREQSVPTRCTHPRQCGSAELLGVALGKGMKQATPHSTRWSRLHTRVLSSAPRTRRRALSPSTASNPTAGEAQVLGPRRRRTSQAAREQVA
jgi:hypothetical protein